jgi:hypothetical protein
LSTLAQNGSSDLGVSFAQPGATASVSLELSPASGVLFNRRGPSSLKLEHPFGKPLELSLKDGQPNAAEPEEYWDRVPNLEFRLPIPKTAKAGTVPLKLQAVLFLCDQTSHICYREVRDLRLELRIGSTGQNRVSVLRLEPPK